MSPSPPPPTSPLRFHAPAPPAEPVALCDSGQLEERGQAYVFDVSMYGEVTRAFVLRFDGQVVSYLNRCAHVPTEMDWQHGEFLDGDKAFILCSIHGAAYEPETGRCVAGPCGRGRLTPLKVYEQGGQVFWQPEGDIRPAPSAPGSPV